MAVGLEAILVCVWRILHFSMRTSSICVQRHPFISAILFFFYIVYAFFDLFVFWFPFLVCIAVLLRVFWTSGGVIILEDKRDEKQKKDRIPYQKPEPAQDHHDAVVCRDSCSSLMKQKSRRTNVRRRINEGDAQACKQANDVPIPITLNDSLIGGTVLIEKIKKAILEDKEADSHDHGESSAAKAPATENDQVLDEQHHSVLDSDLSDSHLLSSDESDEQTDKFDGPGDDGKAAQEDGNKAVQWTDDDQRNLMDLGLSEIERNKRLESLIARRRARKLFKMQVEKGLIDLDTIIPGQMAPIFVARNTPIDYLKGSTDMDTPGSAPSILLPMQNPFDLPYDPLEEKPNLMTDSFQQEFAAAAPQKDMLFCRHESFSLGASAFPFEVKNKAVDGHGFSRFKKQSESGAHDKRIERMLSGKHDEVIDAMLSKAQESIPDIDSSADNGEKQVESPVQQATNSVAPRDGGSRETRSMADMNQLNKVAKTNEVQKEPHLTDESNDESSSESYSEEDEQTYRVSRLSLNAVSKPRNVPPKPLAIPKPAKEPLYDSSPSAPERSRLEERLFYAERGICHTPTYSIASDLQVEVSEVGSPPVTVDGEFEREYMWAASSQSSSRTEEYESRFSGSNKNTRDAAGSSMSSQQPDELDDVCSLSSSMTEIYGDGQTQSMSSDGKSYDDVRQAVEEVGNSRISSSSNVLSAENQEETMKSTQKLVSHSDVNPEEPSNPPGEIETTKKVNVPAADAVDKSKGEKKITDREGGAQIPIKQESPGELSKPNEETNSESSRQLEKFSVSPVEPQASSETNQPIKDNNNSNHSEGDLQKVTEDEGNKELNAKRNSNPIESSKDEKVTAERGVSEVNQTSCDPISSHLSARMQPNDSTLSIPQTGMHSEESTSRLFITSDSANSQELCKPPEKSTEEATVIFKQAEDIGKLFQRATEAAAELKTKAEELARESQKAAEAAVEEITSPRPREVLAEVKRPAEDVTNISEMAREVVAELKKPAEEITSSSSQKVTEGSFQLKRQAEENEDVLRTATIFDAEFRKPAEVLGFASQKATEPLSDFKKPAEQRGAVSQEARQAASDVRKPGGEIGSGSTKQADATAELKIPPEDIGNVSQKAREALLELEKPSETVAAPELTKAAGIFEIVSGLTTDEEITSPKVTNVPVEFKRPVEEIGSDSPRATKAAAELKSPTEDIRRASQIATDALLELRYPSEETGSASKKPSNAGPDLPQPGQEIGILSQEADEVIENDSPKATKAAAELKSSAEDIRSASQKATDALLELRYPNKETGNASQKASNGGPDLTKPSQEIGILSQEADEEIGNGSPKATKAAGELKSSGEDIRSASQKATDAFLELRNPTEEAGNASNACPKLTQPGQEIGNISQRAADPAAEIKIQTKEIERVSGRTAEATVGSKKPAAETGNDSQKGKEATAELLKLAEETGSVFPKTIEAPAELKRPSEETGSMPQKETEGCVELKKPSEQLGNVSRKAPEVAGELKAPAKHIENVTQKASKEPSEKVEHMVGNASETGASQNADEKIGNLAQKATEASPGLKRPVEEIASVSHKAREAALELNIPTEAASESQKGQLKKSELSNDSAEDIENHVSREAIKEPEDSARKTREQVRNKVGDDRRSNQRKDAIEAGMLMKQADVQ